MAKESLAAWLAHPDWPVTKQAMRDLKNRLKAVRRAPAQGGDPVDVRALREEVKAMLVAWKGLQRTQKSRGKELRRQQREKRRTERREAEERRREERRAVREAEREGKEKSAAAAAGHFQRPGCSG